jgi:predicted DNA binding CopG/RHH family protein
MKTHPIFHVTPFPVEEFESAFGRPTIAFDPLRGLLCRAPAGGFMTRKSKNSDESAMPHFRSYQEEAAWFYANAERLMDLLARHGKVVPARKIERTQQLTMRVPVSDVERARQIAADKGLPYQTVLKQAIREGLKKAG